MGGYNVGIAQMNLLPSLTGTAMNIDKAIESFYTEGNWARLDEVRRATKNVSLMFGVYKGQRGKRIEGWQIECFGVYRMQITDWNQCGLAIYSSSHPVAREFTARKAEIRWNGPNENAEIVGALYLAHLAAFDDWIPFDSYSGIRTTSENKFALRGPDFVMRAYAKALRSLGKKSQLTVLKKRKKANIPKVLHFGSSFVVAERFVVKHEQADSLTR